MFNKLIVFLFLHFFILKSYSQEIDTLLEKNFQAFKNRPELTNGIAALHVIDSQNGKVLFESNSRLGLPTASTLKVITAITALEVLGSEYTFTTNLYYTGAIDKAGVLNGDIILQGSGDPTLGSDRYEQTKDDFLLQKWTQAIKGAGINKINGRVIGDDRLFGGNETPGGWIWSDIGNYYGTGISSLNWRENKSGIDFKVGAIGSAATIRKTDSDLSYLTLINQVLVGKAGSGDNVYAYSAPYSNKIYLRGTYGQNLKKTIEISIPDPAYDVALSLHSTLEKNGVIISEKPTTGQQLQEQNFVFSSSTTLLLETKSPKLIDILHWFNQKSINLYGEALLKAIGYAAEKKTSTEESAKMVQKFWNNKLGIAESELKIKDGSGLSPQNNITAQAMNKIMQFSTNRPWYFLFLKCLPTINQMTMKSGTISGTLGYTGFQTAKNGKKYTFTLFVYNYNGSVSQMRQHIFSILNILK